MKITQGLFQLCIQRQELYENYTRIISALHLKAGVI